ncbi:MAG: hypothetical protein IJ467_01435 [Bacteroidaceae bacterium]|nr:hypothetical protein [Bacteroidaceae bacterium]
MRTKQLLFLATMMALPATGQNTIVENYTSLMAIPRQFSAEDKPILHFEKENDEGHSIALYNDDIERINTINVKDGTFNYSLKYQDKTREVKEITKTELYREHYRDLDEYYTFEQFLEEERWKGEVEVRIENGDTIVCATNPYYITRMSMSEYFFGFDYFGTKYPISYTLCKDNVLYQVRVNYEATYTEWQVVGERTEERSCETPVIYLNYINFDGGSSNDNYEFILSQTLFNDDEKFEYIVPKMTLTDISDWSSISPEYGGNVLTLTHSTLISDYAYPACRGVQILSSDGTVIYDIDFGDEFEADEYDCQYMTIITIGGKNYLVVEGHSKIDDENTDCTMFYRINKQTNSVFKVNNIPVNMRVKQQESTINVRLSDTSEASEIIMTNSVGKMLGKKFVPAGENNVVFKSTMPKGVYNVTRFQNGKKIGNGKIILK